MNVMQRRGSPAWAIANAVRIAPTPLAARIAPNVAPPACSSFLTRNGNNTWKGPKNASRLNDAAASVPQSQGLARTKR